MRWLRNTSNPDGLAGRFALLLASALVAADVVALVLLSSERQRLDRASEAGREVERIIARVPAKEAVVPALRRQIARDASTRFGQVMAERLVAYARDSRAAEPVQPVALTALRSEPIIVVDDQGPGIPPERLKNMFEPFVRGEGSRSGDTGGAGLGL